tara:strand:- start:1316 stop:1474 length:159 start_codon:yes stop_codon:yes gene_type:complete
MNQKNLRKRRVAAVRAVLDKNPPPDMRRYWSNVLIALRGWELEKRNAGIGTS